MPCVRRSLRTWGVGCAPRESHERTRSSSILNRPSPCVNEAPAALLESRWEIDVAGHRVLAQASLKAFHDPGGLRMRA